MKHNIPKFLAGDTVIIKGKKSKLMVVERVSEKEYLCNDGQTYAEEKMKSPFDPRSNA